MSKLLAKVRKSTRPRWRKRHRSYDVSRAPSADRSQTSSADKDGDTTVPRNSASRPPPSRDKPRPAGNKPRPPLPKKPPVARKPDRLSSGSSSPVSPTGKSPDSLSLHTQAPSGSLHVNSHSGSKPSHQQTSSLSSDGRVHNQNDKPHLMSKINQAELEELGMYAAGKSLFYVDKSPTEETPPANASCAHQPSSMNPESPLSDASSACATDKTHLSSKTPPKITKRRSLVNTSQVSCDTKSGSVFYTPSVRESVSKNTNCVSGKSPSAEKKVTPESQSSSSSSTAASPTTGGNDQKKLAPKVSPKPSPRPSPKPHPRLPPKPVPRKRIPASPVLNTAPVIQTEEASPSDKVQKDSLTAGVSPVSDSNQDTTQDRVPSAAVEKSHNNNDTPTDCVQINKEKPSVTSKTDGNENMIICDKNFDNPLQNLPADLTKTVNHDGMFEISGTKESTKTELELNSSSQVEPPKSVTDHSPPECENKNVEVHQDKNQPSSCDKSEFQAESKTEQKESDDENTCDMLKEIEDILIKSLGSENILRENTPKSPESSGTVSTERGTGPNTLDRQMSPESLRDSNFSGSLERHDSLDSIGSQSAPGTPSTPSGGPVRPPRPRRIASKLLKQFSFEGFSLEQEDEPTENKPSVKKTCPPKPKRANAPRGARSQSDVTGMLEISDKHEARERDPKRPGLPARHQSFSPGDQPPPLPPRNSMRRVSLDESEIELIRDSQEASRVSEDGKSVPPVPVRTSIPPGTQAPFPKPARSVRSRHRPTRQAPPPPPPHPPAQRKISQDGKSNSLERSSSQKSPEQRISKQYKKIEISESKKTCVVTEGSSDKDESFDHDYHEIGEHPAATTPVKEVTPPPHLPPRSYQPPLKPQPKDDLEGNENGTEHDRSDNTDESEINIKDNVDSVSCSSDSSHGLGPSSRGDHLDMLDVSTPKCSRPRPVSNASQFSTNSSGSGEAFSSPPGHDLSSDEDDVEGDKDDEIYQQQKRDRKIFYIAEEIKKSEEVFVDGLKLLNIDFRNHIAKAAERYDHSLIPNETLNKILDYLPQLHNFNQDLLHDLTERIENWKDNPKVADIFVKKGPFLKLYSSYIRNFENATSLLEDACKKHPEFQKLVREFEMSPRCASLSIKHHMLKPIQRIPQYKLLLQDYLKHLHEGSPDYGHTKTALNIVSEVADHANESMRHGDTVQKLLEIQHSLIGQFEVIQPGRNLIKYGELQKLSRKELQPRMFYLFNDVLLYTTPVSGGFRLNNVLFLTGMKVSTPQQEAFSNEFNIISVQRSFTVAASTPEERDNWLKALTEAIEEVTSRRHTFETRQGPQTSLLDKDFVLGHKAPLWVPDARVTMCMLCLGEFTVTWRRHHCRACGRVVCGYCSDNKAPLRYLKYKSSRVCDDCFEKLEKEVEKEDGKIVDDVAEAGSHSSSIISLKHLKERFQKIRKSGRKTQMKRPAVLKEVHANDEGSVMSGYLRVLKNKKWKRLWFVIKDKVLYTYKASEDMAAIESLPLLGFEVSRTAVWVEGAEPDLVFQLTHSNTQPHIFRTDSAAATEKWLTVMRQSSVA